MINLFHYFFYRTYCFYRNFGETFPEIASTGFLINSSSSMYICMNRAKRLAASISPLIGKENKHYRRILKELGATPKKIYR